MKRKILFGFGAGIYLRPFESIIKRAFLLKEWSKLIGFRRSIRMLLPFKSHLIILFLSMGIIPIISCRGLTIIDSDVGTIRLTINEESISKGIVRVMPDTNSFILTITRGAGDTIFNGLYGSRPKELKVEAGTYIVAVNSTINTGPKFDSPIWSDSRSINVEAGVVTSLGLSCRQSNGGLRLGFSAEFKTKFSAYTPEVSDSKGTATYPYTEDRYMYLRPGQIFVKMVSLNPELVPIPLFSRTIAARDMLSINIKLDGADSASFSGGIQVDTSATWIIDSMRVSGNDGSTKNKAISVDRLPEYIGMKVWATGYIVGGDLTTTNLKFEGPYTAKSNLGVASDPGTKDRARCYSVNLPSGPIQTTYNLVDNPSNLGKKIWVKGTVKAMYLGLVGIDPTTEIVLE